MQLKVFIYTVAFSTLFMLAGNSASADTVFTCSKKNKMQLLGSYLSIYIDTSNHTNVSDIAGKAKFLKNDNSIPGLPVSKNPVWLRLTLCNDEAENIFLLFSYPNTSGIEVFRQSGTGFKYLGRNGNSFPHLNPEISNPDYIFDLGLAKGDTATFYIKVTSQHQIMMPVYAASREDIDKSANILSTIIGLYTGILLAIFLYNLFVYFSTRDKAYLYYIVYIALLGIAQLTLSGHLFIYIWPGTPSINSFAVPLTSSLAGVAAILFTNIFLNTKFYTPRIRKIYLGIGAAFILAIILSLTGNNSICYAILNYASLLAGLLAVSTSFYIARKGYRPAYFYFVSWAAFSIGLIIFVLSNLNILPANNFTTYILYLGSAIEAVLLSIALADKINVLKKENEIAHAEALEASRKNEKLVKEQNIILEEQVALRTKELKDSNHQLSETLVNLKDAQTQLVEAEKMASLGQLTAGIAHEINNPINFVKSNINPLRLDINDIFELIDEYDTLHKTENGEDIKQKLLKITKLKKEIDVDFVKTEISSLVKGIEEGAERTAEIVRGLRTFSRLDEAALKKVNIHEGILSTIVLLKNSIPHNIEVHKNFTASAEVECYPGKINQVFMNIINNAIQAIVSKKPMNEKEFIDISTRNADNDMIEISIKDTGTGMSEEVRQHIFEPFFTTKEVGEGTGLGMAITFKIIQQHAGKIEIISQEGMGAEFILTLPYKQPSPEVN